MPMHTKVIGKDDEGNDVVEVWGAKLNWARGAIKLPNGGFIYYRAEGKGNAHYVVKREDTSEFRYWYVSMHIDGIINHLPTEFMSAYEGKEVCQIFESERECVLSKERAHARIKYRV